MRNIHLGAMLAFLVMPAAAWAGDPSAHRAPDDWFARTHPRREQVNQRLDAQHQRIQHELQTGRITTSEAHALHAEDRSFRAEERSMASHDGGHLTKRDQRLLNQQEGTEREQLSQ